MFNLNRRHTKALEKSARAKKRLADAEESIARNLGAFLRDDDESAQNDPARPRKSVIPPKKPPAKK